MSGTTLTPGFFGKLPARGDFVERRLSQDFVKRWDEWLQQAVAASQIQLGNDWLDIYLTSPLWSFATSPGVLGEQAWAGVMMPSVDKVGRYYPLIVAVELAADAVGGQVDLYSLFDRQRDWFDEVEQTLLSALDEVGGDLETFDDAVSRLGLTVEGSAAEIAFAARESAAGEGLFQFGIADPGQIATSTCTLLGSATASLIGGYSIWTTSGSRFVQPSLLVCAGLPTPESFAALLNGGWSQFGWQSQQLMSGGLAATTTLPAYSASITDKGHVRAANEDSQLCRDDLQAWVVADGLGGHRGGEVASSLVVQVINELPAGDLLTRVEALQSNLRLTQTVLWQLGKRYPDVDQAASTVVAMLRVDDRAAFVWAGDSRVYRVRQGELTQLTTDHAAAGYLDGETVSENMITRAVGGPEALETDVHYETVTPGDRYLLCTDGLYRQLDNAQLLELLSTGAPEDACRVLQDTVLRGKAKDNLTAVVVDLPI